MTDQQILYEIRDRVTRLETKLDNIQDVKEKSYDAYRLSIENQRDIEKIENRFSRIWSAIWTLAVALIVAVINFFLGGK